MKTLKEFIKENLLLESNNSKDCLYDFFYDDDHEETDFDDMKDDIDNVMSKYGTMCVVFQDHGSSSKENYEYYDLIDGDNIIEEYIQKRKNSDHFKIYIMDEYTLGITYAISGPEQSPLFLFRILKDKYQEAFEDGDFDEKDAFKSYKYYEKLP